MDKQLDLTTILIDENGKEHIYRPFALMAYEGDHFVVMRTDDANNVDSDMLVLKAEDGANGAVFNLVEEDKPIMEALYHGLGLGDYLMN